MIVDLPRDMVRVKGHDSQLPSVFCVMVMLKVVIGDHSQNSVFC